VRLLIVDDEAAARRRLAELVEEIDPTGIDIVGEAPDGVAALELVRLKHPDVILLDIAMPEVDGLDVVRHLPEPRPLVIFQTAYQEYAIQAFDHEALDYVVKPVRRERLAQALERARARLAHAGVRGAATAEDLERFGSALGFERVRPARLLVRHGAGHRLMPVADVTRFSAADGLVHAHTAGGAPMTDYTLTELEARLAAGFVRISRADLVNVAHIQRIASNGDGSATLTLSDGATVHVSRRRAASVRRLLRS
jgi:two-component system, LytTR family, response regulator AlgR